MATRHALCPSCRHKLSPLTTECPVCGIPLSRDPLKRPLLFQVSKAPDKLLQPSAPKAFGPPASAPRHGHASAANKIADGSPKTAGAVAKADQVYKMGSQSTFWRLARMEFLEAVFLFIINGLIASTACWQLRMAPQQAYSEFWSFLMPLHFLVSWAYFMLPILLSGSSIAMLLVGFGIADSQPEKRLSFSLFMLVSVALVPLSFLCMVLTPAHATLAELLTGQEIRERIPDLMRRG